MTPRVLVVDDEFGIGDALSDALTDDGYRAEVARNGQLGLEAMRREVPALVILDYMMPVLDGGQVLAQMRADPLLAKVPVILVSAVPRDLISEAPGANAYLNKPFPLIKLLDLVTKFAGPPKP